MDFMRLSSRKSDEANGQSKDFFAVCYNFADGRPYIYWGQDFQKDMRDMAAIYSYY